eukprot:TRINITY_DN8794_c0_g1_i2.p1 TRINITY_DN8794_c0_g1~~TRINITY_DN8794_c0_g1_i2.p1  ORF type:complete len:779 (-),score=172.47 TRINITY_DN8794_c0_g1_i2:133-2385(-)
MDAYGLIVDDKVRLQAEGFAHRRVYEMCMVFKCKTSKLVKFDELDEEGGGPLQEPTQEAAAEMAAWKKQREQIIQRLENSGLRCSRYYSRDRDDVIVKIGADGNRLRDVAARLRYKLELKPEYLSAYVEYRHDFPGRAEMNFSDRRVVSHIYKTHGNDGLPSDDAIFSALDKTLLVDHVVTSGDTDCAAVDVRQLLLDGILKAYFPLPDAPRIQELTAKPLDWVLMGESHARNVQQYFGDWICLHFCWLGFYCKWLLPVALVAFLCGLAGGTPDDRVVGTLSILLSTWALLLPLFWKRQESKLAARWGGPRAFDVDKDEFTRTEHCSDQHLTVAVAQVELYSSNPWKERAKKYAISACATASALAAALFVLTALVASARQAPRGEADFGFLFGQIFLAVVAEFMNLFLCVLARWLTDYENHLTQASHDVNLLAKVILFKFVTFYGALYYIAFAKHNGTWFGAPLTCLGDDCFVDLHYVLGAFVVVRLAMRTASELLAPGLALALRTGVIPPGQKLPGWLRGANSHITADMSNAEQHSKMAKYSSLWISDESLVMHGYVAFFAVAAPWVCAAGVLATVLENWFTMRAMTASLQRPLPRRRAHSEPWTSALEIFGLLAALTNVYLLIFVSGKYDNWTSAERLFYFVFLEHLIVFLRISAAALMPTMPRSVEVLEMKQEQIARRLLENVCGAAPGDAAAAAAAPMCPDFEVFDDDCLDDESLLEPQESLRESERSVYEGGGVMGQLALTSRSR